MQPSGDGCPPPPAASSEPTAGIREKYEALSLSTIRFAFSVSLSDGFIVYHKEPCRQVDYSALFFLHVTPVDETDLPEDRARHRFDNLDFNASSFLQGSRNTCTIKRRLPDYDIRQIVTGQYVREVKDGVELDVALWKTTIDPPRLGQD